MRNLPQVYVPAGKSALPELYLRDANAKRLISRLKWFISTCIVGAAGLCIIGMAMYASTDMEGGSGLVGSFRKAGLAALKPKAAGNLVEDKAALPGQKTDKITRHAPKGSRPNTSFKTASWSAATRASSLR